MTTGDWTRLGGGGRTLEVAADIHTAHPGLVKTDMPEVEKRKRGRPPKYPMRERIDASPERIAEVVLQAKPRGLALRAGVWLKPTEALK